MAQRSALPSVRIACSRRVRFALGGILALGLTGFSNPGSQAPRPAPGASLHPTLRIVAFGSSSTQGIGASGPTTTYPAQLQAILNRMVAGNETVEVINKGIGGQDVDDMISRIGADVIASKPDIVIWQTGSNDLIRHVPLARFDSETRDGIKAMQAAGVRVILMDPQWCPRLDVTGADTIRDTIRRIGQDLGVDVIRRADLMHKWEKDGRLTQAQMLSTDGLHMSDMGYAELARAIAPGVLKARAISTAARIPAHAN